MDTKKRILLVDDDASLLMVIGKLLEVSGYEVLMAKDGLTALNYARQRQPDLIILDIILPKLNGYQICRMLKFDPNCSAVPVMLLSGRDQAEDKDMARDCKADAYLTKPFEEEELLAKIERLLGGPSAPEP